MGRTKGATNKISSLNRLYTNMTVEERLAFLASLITDKIRDDERNGYKLFNKLGGYGGGSTNTTD